MVTNARRETFRLRIVPALGLTPGCRQRKSRGYLKTLSLLSEPVEIDCLAVWRRIRWDADLPAFLLFIEHRENPFAVFVSV
jgi:hypothetical protein